MTRDEIIEKINFLHELGSEEMTYESLINKCPKKKDEINKWIVDVRKEIDSLKDEIAPALRIQYNKDINGRYFIRISSGAISGGVPDDYYMQLFYVNGVVKAHRKTPWHEDLVMDPIGKYYCIKVDKEFNIENISYDRQTDMFDNHPGYLDSNSYYGVKPDTVNGWKEISKDDFEMLMKKCNTAHLLNEKIDLTEFHKYEREIILDLTKKEE
jgi:hypothetical protein